MLNINKIAEGKGEEGDIEKLEELGRELRWCPCGLGQSALNPVLSTIRYFRDEYEEYMRQKCRAGVCQALLQYFIWKTSAEVVTLVQGLSC